MKKIVLVLMVLCLFTCVFTACSNSEQGDEGASQQLSQTTKEPLWEKTLKFGENNTVEFSELVQDNNEHMISVVCDFDGKDSAKEYGRIKTIISLLQYFQKADFMIVIDSGEEKGIVSYDDGELDNLFSYYPSTYITADTSESADEAKFLMDSLKDVLG